MTIGEKVASRFQKEGHAYYDELVQIVDTLTFDLLQNAIGVIHDLAEKLHYEHKHGGEFNDCGKFLCVDSRKEMDKLKDVQP
jgi:hypothetical protein